MENKEVWDVTWTVTIKRRIPTTSLEYLLKELQCLGKIAGWEITDRTMPGVEEVAIPAFSDKEPYIQVEYDKDYFGGDYSSIGDYAYIPLKPVEALGMEIAFEVATGIDPVYIIYYNEDELYTCDGKEWEEPEEEEINSQSLAHIRSIPGV